MAPHAWQQVVEGVEALVDRALDRVLVTGERAASVEEALALPDRDDGVDDLSDRIQRLVVIATPVLRAVGRGARFTRIPWLAVGTTAVSIGSSLRTGVRELQVLAAFVAYRLEDGGGIADPRDVKRLAVSLYVDPARRPDPDAPIRIDKVARRWVVDGALGRDSRPRTKRALEAAANLHLPTRER